MGERQVRRLRPRELIGRRRRVGAWLASGPVPALFTFDHVVVETEGRRILDGVVAEVADGGVTAIAGPSGSGKSTLLRLCNRLEVPASGRVLFRGDDVAGIDPLVLRRRVGMVFQRPTLFAGTVAENLAVAAPDEPDRWPAVLERVGLGPAFLDRVADDLSGGEAQRACLARTLVTEPEVLLMDEVTSSLDHASSGQLERLARDLAGGGVPVLWVSHDRDQIRRIADATILLEAGRVVSAAEHPGEDG
jgi:putative ABC transport system ATP-binding protein